MQEKKSPVFIVATANNIEQLPPEFMRKGRFDEIFSSIFPPKGTGGDLPAAHQPPPGYRRQELRPAALAKETKGFSGAEIEQVINDAMFQAFSQQRDFTTEDILAAIHSTIPLSVSFRRPSISSLPGRAAAGPVWPAASRRPMNPPRATSCITATKTAQGMTGNDAFCQ
ncbi:MAG: hypothetical protein ACLUNX_03390 [Angelakisella sp.]